MNPELLVGRLRIGGSVGRLGGRLNGTTRERLADSNETLLFTRCEDLLGMRAVKIESRASLLVGDTDRSSHDGHLLIVRQETSAGSGVWATSAHLPLGACRARSAVQPCSTKSRTTSIITENKANGTGTSGCQVPGQEMSVGRQDPTLISYREFRASSTRNWQVNEEHHSYV